MYLIEKIDRYLNESKLPIAMVDKAVEYVDKKYPKTDLGIYWFDGKNYYKFDYEYGNVSREYKSSKFEDLGIGQEEEWENETDKNLAKILRAKKAWITDL